MQRRQGTGGGGIGSSYLSAGMGGSGGYSSVPRFEPTTERR